MKFDFFKEMEKGTRKHLKELGYDMLLHDQKGDTALEINGCKELIDKGIAALIVSPIKPEVLPPIVEEAHKNNIPVIINDIGGGGSDYDALVVSDCIGGGRMAGEYLQKVLNEKGISGPVDVAILRNNPSVSAAYSRGDGFREIAVEAGWNVIKDASAEGEAEVAYTVMKEILKSNPEVKGVFCTNDPMATAAARACFESGRKDILVIGFNGDIIALNAIKEGKMIATIQQFPYAMGETAADLVDMLIKGQNIEFDIPENKQILIPVKLIDKNNVDEAYAALH